MCRNEGVTRGRLRRTEPLHRSSQSRVNYVRRRPMFLRLKILTAAVITCALAGAPAVVLAQDPNQTQPAQPAPAPADQSSTPATPPSPDTVQPNAPAPAPAVNPSDVTPPPGRGGDGRSPRRRTPRRQAVR